MEKKKKKNLTSEEIVHIFTLCEMHDCLFLVLFCAEQDVQGSSREPAGRQVTTLEGTSSGESSSAPSNSGFSVFRETLPCVCPRSAQQGYSTHEPHVCVAHCDFTDKIKQNKIYWIFSIFTVNASHGAIMHMQCLAYEEEAK